MKEFLNKLSKEVKFVVVIVSAGFGLVTGVWAFDDRYIDQAEIVASLKSYDAQIQQRIHNLERDAAYREYNNITERYFQLKHLMAMNPGNPSLREEFEWVSNRRANLARQLGL